MNKAFQNAFREISRSKFGYLINIIVYGIMVAVLVAMAGVARSSEDSSRNALKSIGTHILAYRGIGGVNVGDETCCEPVPDASGTGFEARRPLEGFVAGNSGMPSALMEPSYVESLKKIEHVAGVSPYTTYRFTGDRIFTVGGYRPEDKVAVDNNVFNAGNIVEGRVIKPDEARKLLLEKSYADTTGLSVGESVSVGGVPFEVVGIVNPPLRPGKADMYTRFDDLRGVLQKYGFTSPYLANSMLIEVTESWRQDEVIEKIRGKHPELSIYTYGCYKPATKGMAVVERHSGLLAALVWLGLLAYAGTIQWTAVRSRRREIGILKSLGWSGGEIGANIFLRGIFVAAAGSLLGMACGAYLLSRLGMPAADMPTLFLIAVFGGILSGLPSLLYAVQSREVVLLKRF